MEPKQGHSIFPFLGIATLAHVSGAIVMAWLIALHPEGCNPSTRMMAQPVEVSLVPLVDTAGSTMQVDRELEQARRALEEAEKKIEQQEQKEEGQVVELPRPAEERRPDKARFLSEYDTKVEKETKGPPRAMREQSARAMKSAPPIVIPPSKASPAQPQAPTSSEPQQKKQSMLAMREPRRSDERSPQTPPESVAPQPDPQPGATRRDETQKGELALGKEQTPQPEDVSQEVNEPKPTQGNATTPMMPQGVTQSPLALTPHELTQLSGGGGVNDALSDEIEEGDETMLNSKRWRYAAFFNRVKRQVAQNWHPDRAYRRRDPNGNVYGSRDRLTVVRVNLTPAGKLQSIHLETPSGLDFLDDEAVASFRAAQPFPNPPKGLVDNQTGMISFRFGFLFEISTRPSLRFFGIQN